MTFCSKKMWLNACPLNSLPATHPHPDSYKPFKTEADVFVFLTIRLQTCVVLPCSSWKQQDIETPPEHSRSFSQKMPLSGLLFYHWEIGGPYFWMTTYLKKPPRIFSFRSPGAQVWSNRQAADASEGPPGRTWDPGAVETPWINQKNSLNN